LRIEDAKNDLKKTDTAYVISGILLYLCILKNN